MPSRDGDTQERTRRAQRLVRPRGSQSGRMRWKTLLEDWLENAFSSFPRFLSAPGKCKTVCRAQRQPGTGVNRVSHRSRRGSPPSQDEALFSSLVRPAAKARTGTIAVTGVSNG
jgi:hypothetical protein